jgi:ribosomal protein L7/L12
MKLLQDAAKRFLVELLQNKIYTLEDLHSDVNYERLTIARNLLADFKDEKTQIYINPFIAQTGTCEVKITNHGPVKIAVIKAIRTAIPGYGLADAKLASESSRPVIVGTSWNEAQRIKAILEAKGATVHVTSQDRDDMVCSGQDYES